MTLLVIRAAVAAICSIPLLLHMFGIPVPLPIQGSLATIVQFFSGYPFYIGAFLGLKKRSANMDTLVALGTSAAYLFSFYTIFADPSRGIYFETSSLLITFILFGRVMEHYSNRKAQSGMKALLSIQPELAHVKRGKSYDDVPVSEVQLEDLFQVKPGERVPVDGEVIAGSSAIDESMLTGESLTREKNPGDPIFAGTVNQHGTFTAKATRTGKDTALNRIIQLVQNAQESKAPIERLADRVSAVFVPAVLIISLLTLTLWALIAKDFSEGIISAVAVLVIACPCALGLAVPIVILVACSRAAQVGIFIKNAAAIELAQKIDTLLIDKTGTVTEGTLSIERVELDDKYIPVVKDLSLHSEHPASQAIAHFLTSPELLDTQMIAFRSTPGQGVSGYFDNRPYYLGSPTYLKNQQVPIDGLHDPLERESGMIVGFATEKLLLGYFVLSDTIKEGSQEAIETLKRLGITTIMLTGDRYKVAEKVAEELHFDEVKAELLPEDKATQVQKAKASNKTVGMVGDGVNDAPALASADVGFAIASGTDIAMESAAIGLMRSHLFSVVHAILLSKAAHKKIVQNLTFAFGYNTLGIPLAAFGLLNPIIAGTAMALSSLSVVFNALHLRKITFTNSD